MKSSLIILLTIILCSTLSNSHADSPIISIPSITPSAILMNKLSEITISAEILAPDKNLKDVLVKMNKDGKFITLGKLHDNGKNGDAAAGDRTYSGKFKVFLKKPGKIFFKVTATNKNNNSSEGEMSFEVKKNEAVFKPSKIISVSGNNQTGNPGEILKEPFIIAVENELGKSVPDVPINISISRGEGKIIIGSGEIENHNGRKSYKSDNTATIYTNSKGRVKFRIKLGDSDKDLSINVTSPSIPGESITFFAIVASVDTPDQPTDLDISGNYVFIADRFSGLQIVDVSNPLNPKIINRLSEIKFLEKSLSSQCLSIRNNICYLANYDPNKLFIIDVNNPEDIDFQKDSNDDGVPDAVLRYIDLPVEVSDVPIRSLINSHYIFILYQKEIKENGKVVIIDISDLTVPTFTTSVIDIGGIPSDFKIKDNFLYVASGDSGITLINISKPSSPAILNAFGGIVSSSILISDNYLYYVDYDNKLHVFDISIPKSPIEISSILTIEGRYADIAISDNFLYLASQETGIQVLDVSDKNNIKLIGKIDTPSIAQSIKISGNFAYILDEAFGLYVVSIPGTNEKDSDNDSVIDFFDTFPQDPDETADTDNDELGNNSDTDDDNDGYSDTEEINKGTDPLNPKDFPVNLPNANSKEIFVDSKTSPGGDGSENNPYSSITEALLAVKSARTLGNQIDEINVKPGIYSTDKEFFPIRLPSNIVFKGSGASNTVIDAGNSSWAILIKNEANISVEGVTIKNGNEGIVASNTNSLNIRNNVIDKNKFGGIEIGINSFNNKIENNIIKNNSGRGLSVLSSSSADTIGNNIINYNEDFGIFIALSSSAEDISGNIIVKNKKDGIQVYSSSFANTITNNIISKNSNAGIIIAEKSIAENISDNIITKNGMDGIQVGFNSTANIRNNTISKNKMDGIIIAVDSRGEEISGNTLTKNFEDGIQVLYNSSVNVKNNNISQNARTGILISTNSASEDISGNTMVGNDLAGIYVQDNSSVDIRSNSIKRNKHDGIFIGLNSIASIGIDGEKLEISYNGDDGIDIEPDSTASINFSNIFFKGNQDKEIEGNYESR